MLGPTQHWTPRFCFYRQNSETTAEKLIYIIYEKPIWILVCSRLSSSISHRLTNRLNKSLSQHHVDTTQLTSIKALRSFGRSIRPCPELDDGVPLPPPPPLPSPTPEDTGEHPPSTPLLATLKRGLRAPAEKTAAACGAVRPELSLGHGQASSSEAEISPLLL